MKSYLLALAALTSSSACGQSMFVRREPNLGYIMCAFDGGPSHRGESWQAFFDEVPGFEWYQFPYIYADYIVGYPTYLHPIPNSPGIAQVHLHWHFAGTLAGWPDGSCDAISDTRDSSTVAQSPHLGTDLKWNLKKDAFGDTYSGLVTGSITIPQGVDYSQIKIEYWTGSAWAQLQSIGTIFLGNRFGGRVQGISKSTLIRVRVDSTQTNYGYQFFPRGYEQNIQRGVRPLNNSNANGNEGKFNVRTRSVTMGVRG